MSLFKLQNNPIKPGRFDFELIKYENIHICFFCYINSQLNPVNLEGSCFKWRHLKDKYKGDFHRLICDSDVQDKRRGIFSLNIKNIYDGTEFKILEEVYNMECLNIDWSEIMDDTLDTLCRIEIDKIYYKVI